MLVWLGWVCGAGDLAAHKRDTKTWCHYIGNLLMFCCCPTCPEQAGTDTQLIRTQPRRINVGRILLSALRPERRGATATMNPEGPTDHTILAGSRTAGIYANCLVRIRYRLTQENVNANYDFCVVPLHSPVHQFTVVTYSYSSVITSGFCLLLLFGAAAAANKMQQQ